MSWTKWNGKKVTQAVAQRVNRAALKAAEVTGEAADQQVPHDEGFLQDSKTIKTDPANPLTVQIGYGGSGDSGKPLVPYAVKWHENDANFQKGRKKNYLRQPVKTVAPKAFKRALTQELGDL